MLTPSQISCAWPIYFAFYINDLPLVNIFVNFFDKEMELQPLHR
jgi:hypothetical protein